MGVQYEVIVQSLLFVLLGCFSEDQTPARTKEAGWRSKEYQYIFCAPGRHPFCTSWFFNTFLFVSILIIRIQLKLSFYQIQQWSWKKQCWRFTFIGFIVSKFTGYHKRILALLTLPGSNQGKKWSTLNLYYLFNERIEQC